MDLCGNNSIMLFTHFIFQICLNVKFKEKCMRRWESVETDEWVQWIYQRASAWKASCCQPVHPVPWLTLFPLCLLEAESVPGRHLAGPDGDFQTQELALLQLQGHADHLPDVLRGHVWWRLLLQRYLPWGHSGEDVSSCRSAREGHLPAGRGHATY